MQGQINKDSNLGKIISFLVKRIDVKTIVEIGTWNGLGSTRCILDNLNTSNQTFYTIESNITMYNQAISNNKYFYNKNNINFLYGRIIELQDLDIVKLSFTENQWLDLDRTNYKNCPFVLDLLPQNIDLLILDGGEFSTFAEFNKLKNRSKIVVLDDCNCRKNKSNLEYLRSSKNYKKLYEDLNDRNGWSVYIKE